MYLNHDGMDEVVNTKTSFQHREPGIWRVSKQTIDLGADGGGKTVE